MKAVVEAQDEEDMRDMYALNDYHEFPEVSEVDMESKDWKSN